MFACFHLVILNLCFFRKSSWVYFGIFFLAFVRCKFFTGGRAREVRADLGPLVPLKFLFGSVFLLIFHWFVASCRSQPCGFSETKTFATLRFGLFLFPLSWCNRCYFCQNYNLTRQNLGSQKSFSEGLKYPIGSLTLLLIACPFILSNKVAEFMLIVPN